VYTAPCAAWHTPVFLLNSRLGRFTATGFRSRGKPSHVRPASLLPKLRDHYAEFLDHVSLVHLRLLASPTCVGLRYGHLTAPDSAFLARRLHTSCVWVAPHAPHQVSGPEALHPWTANPQGRSHFVPVSLNRSSPSGGAGISTRCPSATPLGPRLRVRLTLR
jgi:hypothetical protein